MSEGIKITSEETEVIDCTVTNSPTLEQYNAKCKEVERLKEKVEAVYSAGLEGIYYVGIANYREREAEAIRKLQAVMDEVKE